MAGASALNHYAHHDVICTTDEKAVAAKYCGSTSWNIINNSKRDEVYMLHARNNDHFVDDDGLPTSQWFDKRKRCCRPDGTTFQQSHCAREALECPPTAGKTTAEQRHRQAKQLCQFTAPRDYGSYTNMRGIMGTPRTPGRPDQLDRTMTHQKFPKDPMEPKPTPRVIEKKHWTPRRGEAMTIRAPPNEFEMFQNVDQLRAEPHVDLIDQNFAEELHQRRPSGRALSTGASGSTPRSVRTPRSARTPRTSALNAAGSKSTRRPLEVTEHAAGGPERTRVREPHERTRYSLQRLEPDHHRDITAWAVPKEKLKRADHCFDKPLLQANSSCVKYDIVTNERQNFWY